MNPDLCPICGKNLALVGKSHKCAPIVVQASTLIPKPPIAKIERKDGIMHVTKTRAIAAPGTLSIAVVKSRPNVKSVKSRLNTSDDRDATNSVTNKLATNSIESSNATRAPLNPDKPLNTIQRLIQFRTEDPDRWRSYMREYMRKKRAAEKAKKEQAATE